MKNLVGKWIIINDENGERYVTGHITVVHEQLLYVTITPAAGPPYAVLEHVEDMLDGRMRIFESELEMKQWLEWANTPPEDEGSGPRVIPIHGGLQ